MFGKNYILYFMMFYNKILIGSDFNFVSFFFPNIKKHDILRISC